MKVHYYPITVLLLVSMASCSHDKKEQRDPSSTAVQTEADPAQVDAQKKASNVTEGWPESSATAASEMIQKHGEPTEVTDDTLIWRNMTPFERITVNKEVHSSKFPVLHQNAVNHTVKYRVPEDKIEDVRKFNGDIMVDSTKGEMTASGENESMNMLNLNMAHQVILGNLSPEEARTQFGKESMAYMNGQRNASTQALNFGQQINTGDKGESISQDIKWEDGSPAAEETKQSQEEAPTDTYNMNDEE